MNERGFWNLVDKHGPDGCWQWKGEVDKSGYGVASIDGTSWVAARYAWAQATQTTPVVILRHACGNPACVNPAHMRPSYRAPIRLRRLSPAQEKELRDLYRRGVSSAHLSKIYDVSSTTVHRTIRRTGQAA